MVTENPSSQRGSSRIINTELNLVPFIDLLSTLVLFLLVSAVWLQVSVIPASTQKSGEASTSPLKSNEDATVRIFLSTTAVEILWPQSLGSLTETLDKTGDKFPWDSLKASLEKNAAQMKMAYLSSDDKIPYGQVIQALDQIKASGLPTVSLRTE